MKKSVILILFCLLSSTAFAQVYKCTNAHGNLIFSDKPCAENAQVVQGLDADSQGISGSSDGPASSLTLADGSILPFREIVSIEVKTKMGYKTGKTGMYVFYEGTDRLVAFENLVSMHVLTWDSKSCGNSGHLCRPMVRITTAEREITSNYEALRNIKLIVYDDLDGAEKEMTVWFGNKNRPHIRAIRF